MRKALIIGIDYYSSGGSLTGCVNDAHSLKAMLDRHADGSPNFGVKLRTASSGTDAITRRMLKDLVVDLFQSDDEIALLYFAGHGHLDAAGGYICGSESTLGDEGLSLADIMALAGGSKAKNRIVILDSCHSGAAGESALRPGISEVTEGMSILTASRSYQACAAEWNRKVA